MFLLNLGVWNGLPLLIMNNWGDPRSTQLKVGARLIAISTVSNDVEVLESKYPAYSSKKPPCCKHVYVFHIVHAPSIDEAVGCHDER